MKHKFHFLKLAAFTVMAILAAPAARAVDYHVNTAQALQNALTLAASDGANNTIWITNGYYTGNFNYNSSGGLNLTVTNEPGVANTQITLDGAGLGRALSITSSGTGAITVSGITFSRNCGSTSIGALRIAAGSGATILVNGCQFLSPTNTSGEGFELDSGLNVAITNCVVTGSTSASASTGISVSGVTGTVNIQYSNFTTNRGSGILISGASQINITGDTFTGNSGNTGGGANCSAATITIYDNNFTANTCNGVNGNGGGIYCDGTIIVALSGNTFINNSVGTSPAVSYGGAASCNGTTITLTNNTFIGNSTSYLGGGLYCSASSAIIIDNIFSGNSGGNGGGIYCSGAFALMGNTFTGNSSGGNGGGVWCSGTLSLTNNTFTGNSASGGSGGGVYCTSTATNPIVFNGNIFQQNNAVTGGGIYVSGTNIKLLDDLVFNNSQTSASSQGGGVWVDATSTLFMINNTITGNTAAGGGGGAAFEVTGTVELLNVYNNIIWGNSANGNGGDVWLAGTGQKKVFDFNDADSIYGVWDIALNDIDAAPQFFNPVNGDYHFPATSPCANAGTINAPSLPLTDLDGNSRTNSAGQVDMGCYEFNTTATHPADTNGDFVITPAEYAAYAAAWQNGQTWTNGPNPGPNPIPANYLTRAGYLMTNGGAYYNDGSARPTNWKLIGH